MELLTGPCTARAIYVAVKLGIPEELAKGPLTPRRWPAGWSRTPMRSTGWCGRWVPAEPGGPHCHAGVDHRGCHRL